MLHYNMSKPKEPCEDAVACGGKNEWVIQIRDGIKVCRICWIEIQNDNTYYEHLKFEN